MEEREHTHSQRQLVSSTYSSVLRIKDVLLDFRNYAKYLLKIKHREGGRMVAFNLKPIQEKIATTILSRRGQPVRLQVLKARRLGVSSIIAGIFFHRIVTRPYQRGNVIAHRGDSAEAIFSIYEKFFDHLPDTFDGVPVKPKKSGTRGKRLYFPSLHSELVVGTAGPSAEFGRGGDCQLLHLSEVAFWLDPVTSLAALFPQVPATGDNIIVLESSANGPDDFWHNLWINSCDGRSGYIPMFFAWFEDPDHRMPRPLPPEEWSDEEREAAERFGLDPYQMAWRRYKLETECFGREDIFQREYPETPEAAFVSIGNPAWEREIVLSCYERAQPKIVGEIGDKGVIRAPGGRLMVWEEPADGADYVIGVDVAAGLDSGDLSVAEVYRVGRRPGQWPIQVAEWAGREDVVTFARTLTMLGYYYKKALLAVEVTGLGRGTQNALQRIYFYPRLHRWIPWDRYKSQSDVWGWETSYKSRPVMLGLGDWLFRSKKILIRSPHLVEELLNFQQVGPEKYEGMRGDDRIMATLIAVCSWFQHQFPGVALKELREVLAKLYGSPRKEEELKQLKEPSEERDLWWERMKRRSIVDGQF